MDLKKIKTSPDSPKELFCLLNIYFSSFTIFGDTKTTKNYYQSTKTIINLNSKSKLSNTSSLIGSCLRYIGVFFLCFWVGVGLGRSEVFDNICNIFTEIFGIEYWILNIAAHFWKLVTYLFSLLQLLVASSQLMVHASIQERIQRFD